MEEWNKYIPPLNATMFNIITIIEDAMCMGFEFKVEEQNIYYREK